MVNPSPDIEASACLKKTGESLLHDFTMKFTCNSCEVEVTFQHVRDACSARK